MMPPPSWLRGAKERELWTRLVREAPLRYWSTDDETSLAAFIRATIQLETATKKRDAVQIGKQSLIVRRLGLHLRLAKMRSLRNRSRADGAAIISDRVAAARETAPDARAGLIGPRII